MVTIQAKITINLLFTEMKLESANGKKIKEKIYCWRCLSKM